MERNSQKVSETQRERHVGGGEGLKESPKLTGQGSVRNGKETFMKVQEKWPETVFSNCQLTKGRVDWAGAHFLLGVGVVLAGIRESDSGSHLMVL